MWRLIWTRTNTHTRRKYITNKNMPMAIVVIVNAEGVGGWLWRGRNKNWTVAFFFINKIAACGALRSKEGTKTTSKSIHILFLSFLLSIIFSRSIFVFLHVILCNQLGILSRQIPKKKNENIKSNDTKEFLCIVVCNKMIRVNISNKNWIFL